MAPALVAAGALGVVWASLLDAGGIRLIDLWLTPALHVVLMGVTGAALCVGGVLRPSRRVRMLGAVTMAGAALTATIAMGVGGVRIGGGYALFALASAMLVVGAMLPSRDER